MSEQEPAQKSGSLFKEAIRRRVFRSAVAYVLASWVLVQVTDILNEAFNGPDWVVRALVVFLLLLFPLVLVISWIYDISFSGIRRTEGDSDTGLSAKGWFRTSLIGVTAAVCLVTAGWIWSSGQLFSPSFKVAAEAEFPKVVAVAPFRMLSGGSGASWLGEGIALLVRENLAQSEFLHVVSPRRLRAIENSGDSQGQLEELVEATAQAGIRFLISGNILSTRSGYTVSVEVLDTADDTINSIGTYQELDEASALEKASLIAQAARKNFKVPQTERVDVFAANFASENTLAYQAFVAGLEFWINFDYSGAEQSFRAALDVEPGFGIARYHLAWALASQDRFAEARDELQKTRETGHPFNPREQMYVDALGPLLDNDLPAAKLAYEALIEAYPYEAEAKFLYAEVLTHLYDYDGALEQYRLLTQFEPEVHTGWSGLGFLNLEIGNLDAAATAIDRFAKLAPENPNAYLLRGDLNRARDDLAAARADFAQAIRLGPELQEAVVSLAITDYLSGDISSAVAGLEQLAKNPEAVPRFRLQAAFELGGILSGLGEFERYERLLAELDGIARDSERFYAKALIERARALLRSGKRNAVTDDLIAQAIAAAPQGGVPTRYLFVRGESELAAAEYQKLEVSVQAISSFALPPENPDRTEDKAANYLQGLAADQQGQLEGALGMLQSAVGEEGYEYAVYKRALGIVIAKHDPQAAQTLFGEILVKPDAINPRLEFEYDRAMTRLSLAELHFALGETALARDLATQLLERWRNADPGFSGVGRARAILN